MSGQAESPLQWKSRISRSSVIGPRRAMIPTDLKAGTLNRMHRLQTM